ncbi:hypothetical protein [Pseudomonas syringae]|uniref:hypothetical protein n=1 Tax=Pseudomonas syringae TaxID=317 RepID=UPI001F2A9BA7|nr:hypothetical protein [Pseudomonas syringae]MCF5371337.1 hypothetical protein [Pseudomonas syringae]MCF5382066.1 hypothetical protein [Pseudomonas syringae]MCF5419350.1 hypothetical protein [Pseudomonas syringae]MCF5455030.1 hypothetical protein [Pseudomonas syringae]MCF5458394.1 hypothetical protein [Pseudomonas syringae]
MKLGKFVTVYEKSLIALNVEAQELQDRISRIESRTDIQPGGRLASKLNLYRRQLTTLKSKHRAAVCWIGTVAQPIYSILEKRLGTAYKGIFSRVGENQASLRFVHQAAGVEQGMVLKFTLAQLCTEPSREAVLFMVERSIFRSGSSQVVDQLTLETTLSDVLTPLRA